MLNHLGINLDLTGTDVTALSPIFADRAGHLFRGAVAEAFTRAQLAVQSADPTTEEVWDRVFQQALGAACDRRRPFTAGVELRLEKTSGAKSVWSGGVQLFPGNTGRPWICPDGLITFESLRVALEFDHGASIGHWAQQLIKALRSTASPKVNGLLFCYCTPKDPAAWFSGRRFTDEFKTLVNARQGAKIGILTIGWRECEQLISKTWPMDA